MKVFEINGGVFGSTGRIMFGIAAEAQKQGMEVRCASPITSTNKEQQPLEDYYKIGTYHGRRISVLLARITGFNGCFSYFATKALLRELDSFSPDIVHLHTLHNSYINLPLLFSYLSKTKVKVVWTLHDCWAFTGQCPHFVVEKCEKWKSGCNHCVKYKEYPTSVFDNTKKMWRLKKKWFNQIADLTIVTPSVWLRQLVEESFLQNANKVVIHNGINLDVFRPRKSERLKEYAGKHIVLGVAFGWGYRKGLDVFIKLSKILPPDYQIVLVGTDELVEKEIPDSIACIRRTQNQDELAEIYSVAQVFVNPTREDTFPTVNIESIACGTPVVTFQTGGSPEIIDKNCGIVVDKNDIASVVEAIKSICESGNEMRQSARDRSRMFDMDERFAEYVALYKALR